MRSLWQAGFRLMPHEPPRACCEARAVTGRGWSRITHSPQLADARMLTVEPPSPRPSVHPNLKPCRSIPASDSDSSPERPLKLKYYFGVPTPVVARFKLSFNVIIQARQNTEVPEVA